MGVCVCCGGLLVNEPFLNTPEHSVFLNKFSPQEKQVNQSLMYWNFIRAQLTWGKENTQSQPVLEVCRKKILSKCMLINLIT